MILKSQQMKEYFKSNDTERKLLVKKINDLSLKF
jgi:hypothetical protein